MEIREIYCCYSRTNPSIADLYGQDDKGLTRESVALALREPIRIELYG